MGLSPSKTYFVPLIILAALLTRFSFTTAPFLRQGNKKDMDYSKHGQYHGLIIYKLKNLLS